MKVILLGATGMVGQGVLRECLLDASVEGVLSLGRTSTGRQHDKLREIVQRDLFDLSPIREQLTGFDACFFCLGVSSVGMKPEEYRRVTYDLTMSVARTLAAQDPRMTFIYVSGAGTNSDGRSMWARVKGQTENELLRMPFRAAYMFRPGYIQPLHGVRAKTGWVRSVYLIFGSFYPVLRLLFRNHVTTTERLGRAMIRVARDGAPKRILESIDIDRLGSLRISNS